MYKINYKNLRKDYLAHAMILGIGVVLVLIFGVGLFQGSIKKLSMDGEVKAYDVQVQYRKGKKAGGNQPTYYYMVNGKKYEYTLSYYPQESVSKLKAKNIIYYKSEDPSICVSEYETTFNLTNVLVMLLMVTVPVAGLKGILNVRKRIKKVKWLAKNGTLIKGLKYEMISTGKTVNNRRLMAIQVSYELPSGSIIKLISDARYDLKSYDEDGLVDLLMDPNDSMNYYIDFNIN